MSKSLAEWKANNLGKKIDLDNQSYDCVDVAKSWAEYLYDKPWTQSLSWGNAKDIYTNVSSSFWDRIPRGSGARPGDLICMGAAVGGGAGHIALILEVRGGNVIVAQQDTFKQVPVYTGVFDQNASYVQGYLRPKTDFTVDASEKLQPYQRKVGGDIVNYRQAANKGAQLLVTDSNPDGQFSPGEVLDFKGYVHGESVDGNDVWFVGMYSGGYAWSGAFEDQSPHDLPDLTPTQVSSIQRKINSDAMNWRTKPELMPDNVIKVLDPGKVLDLTGYVRGTIVDGNNVWFQYKEGATVGYVWSGGFSDSGTHDLTDVSSQLGNTQTQPITPSYPSPTTDMEVTKVYNKKHPIVESYAPTDLVGVGNGQQLRSEAANALSLMKSAAMNDNITLTPQSGYRSYTTQRTLYDNYVKQDGKDEADRYSARAGYSEHQTGLTIDFAPIDDSFGNLPAYNWLVNNAYKFGYILRYPSDKESVTGYMSEPWHWRYVGVTVAADMRSKNKTTLEEYFNVEGGLYPDQGQPSNPTEPNSPSGPTDPTKPVIKLSDLKVVITNVAVTFVQAFVATWALTGYKADKAALGGAVGAGLSVVWNTIVKPYLQAKGVIKK
jgi:D-alanyl-D-alanine carboxypeptidase